MVGRKKGGILLVVSSALCMSCFFMPLSPAKDHNYILIQRNLNNDPFFKLGVVSTVKNKMFYFKSNNEKKFDSIFLCNKKLKKIDCFKLKLDTISEKFYTLNLRVSDFKFYKRIDEDTIRIKCFNKNNVEELRFIYDSQKN